MSGWTQGAWLLSVDTCGTEGSLALGRVEGEGIAITGEASLAGGEFAAGLLPAVVQLLQQAGIAIADLGGITVVAGPGSFTGVRIGLASVKAIAEAAALPVIPVSRLAILAHQAKSECAVLDAYRGQFFCGFFSPAESSRELLLTAGEINAMGGLHGRVGVCEESVAQLLEELHGAPELIRVPAPTAAAALAFSAPQWQAAAFADVATLDGHYLRGADAKVASRTASRLASGQR